MTETINENEDNYTDLTVNNVCFNCENGFVLGNRTKLSLYSSLLAAIFKSTSGTDLMNKKCITLKKVMCENVELLFKSILGDEFVETDEETLEHIRHTATVLGMKIEQKTTDNRRIAFRVLSANSDQIVIDTSIVDVLFSTEDNRSTAAVSNEQISNDETRQHTQSQQIRDDFEVQDICFNCCDGIVFGNRKQLSLYSLSLEQIFHDYPGIANNVSTPGVGKGIFLSNSRSDVELLFQTIITGEFARLEVNRLSRVQQVAHVLGMKLDEFPNVDGSVWVCVAQRSNNDANNSITNFQITEITDNSFVQTEEIVEYSSEDRNLENDIDETLNDIRFNCADGHILGSRQQLSMYSTFLKQLFEEFPNIAAKNESSHKRGINVPTVHRKDIDILFQAMSKKGVIAINAEQISGICHTAMMLQIKLHQIPVDGGECINIQVVPTDSGEVNTHLPNVIVNSVSNDDVCNETDNVTDTQVSATNEDSDDCKIIDTTHGSNEEKKKSGTPLKYIGKARRSFPFSVKKEAIKKERTEPCKRHHKGERNPK
ncbi:hypothetical protein B4U80_13422, partial [Leptotrombidium deliense]